MTGASRKLLTLNVNQSPVLENALGPGVGFQPLFLDTANGIWCIRALFGPGITLPSHLHTGPVHAYTLSGNWYYAEHPEQPQTAGSYLYEPASSVPHLFKTPAENTEVTEIIFTVFGANVNFDEQGRFHSVMDAGLIQQLVKDLQQAQNRDVVPYIVAPGPDVLQ
ncbi:2,4'-dihydroxyacetophenone dioxygenase family protein [Oxalobacteraceae bacterium OTU3CINTB1]|nr:2,4'-dihydroxyacetophenone dioxygenase family protein [Oxalobacteraceae bacterium OTU3CINTB1]